MLKKNTERNNRILELRRSGWTYSRIGKEVNLSAESVRRTIVLYQKELNKIQGAPESLPIRVQNLLAFLNIADLPKEDIKEMILRTPCHFLNRRNKNFGRKSFDILCQWVGIKERIISCPHCEKMKLQNKIAKQNAG